MLFPTDRGELRRMYVDAWTACRRGAPLTPLQSAISDVVALHPEYHPLLEGTSENAVSAEWTPSRGEQNPFLHMGLHLAIREQCNTNRPVGIAAERKRLVLVCGDAHEAEHRMMEVLGEALWEAQRAGHAPDEAAYLARLRHLQAGPVSGKRRNP
jgi:hypothetical protein